MTREKKNIYKVEIAEVKRSISKMQPLHASI